MVEEGELNVLVKPVKNPELSAFITELTGIRQIDLNKKGVSLKEASERFLKFVEDYPAFCWGIDTEILEQNHELQGSDLVLPREQFANLKPLIVPLLQKIGIDESKYSSGTLIQAFGGTGAHAHDAVNDMRNLLEAMRELQKHE